MGEATNTYIMRVLIFLDGKSYVAQCVDYDICASAPSPEELEDEFGRTLMVHVLASRAEGVAPFECLGPAPERFRKAWNEGRELQFTATRFATEGATDCIPSLPALKPKLFAGRELQHA